MKYIRIGLAIVLFSVLFVNGTSYNTYAADQELSPISYQDISSSYKHTCAKTSSGKLVCWGSNVYGQIGSADDTFIARSTPGPVPGLEGMVISEFVAGGYNSCVIDEQGALYCWGSNNARELGNPDFSRWASGSPVAVAGMDSGVLSVAAGNGFVCALKQDGGIYCWGWDYYEMFSGDTDNATREAPELIGHIEDPKEIYANGGHACVLSYSGEAMCWGLGEAGQLGNGENFNQKYPVTVSKLSNIISMSLGDFHTCAITGVTETEPSSLWCWGESSNGKLGIDPSTIVSGNVPNQVTSLGGIALAVAAGKEHTCAIIQDGEMSSVQCWGYNEEGQLGIGNTTSQNFPVDVPDSTGAVKISAGESFTSIVLNTGEVKSWGGNSEGQLGNGFFFRRQLPIHLDKMSESIADIVSGENHSCALTRSGGVYCWGRNSYGQLGNGTTQYSADPVQVIGLTSGVRSIAAGTYHNCALLIDGRVKCWGFNPDGRLGTGNFIEGNLSTPEFVVVDNTDSPLTSVAKTVTGFWHNCALIQDGSIQCWGDDLFGQLGMEPPNGSYIISYPVEVPFDGEFVDVSAGEAHSCGVANDGFVYCWGGNLNAGLGNGSSDSEIIAHPIPEKVKNLTNNVIAVDSGGRRTCILTNSGEVSCWGGGNPEPGLVPGLESGVAEITVGGAIVNLEHHACALMENTGAVKCWGYNNYSQLGDGTYRFFGTNTPVDVLGLTGNAASVTAGATSNCAIFESGSAACWGSDYQMETTPVKVVEVDEMFRPASIFFSNYYEGAPESYFVITGLYFPPNKFVDITINDEFVGRVMANETGVFKFFTYFDTEGEYTIKVLSTGVQANQTATLYSSISPDTVPVVGQGEVTIQVAEGTTQRIKEGDGYTIGLDSGYLVFLPITIR